MDWGMANRMHRMFSPVSGNSVMLAVDHGYFMGPTHRLEDARATITPLLPHADALALTRGIVRHALDPTTAPHRVRGRQQGGDAGARGRARAHPRDPAPRGRSDDDHSHRSPCLGRRDGPQRGPFA